MCLECNKHICPSNCPNADTYDNGYDNQEYELVEHCVCACCEEVIVQDELFAYIEDEKYCLNCIRDFEIDDILQIMKIKSIVELVSELGFVFDKN